MATQTQKTSIYAVRTTSGQERTVVDLMASRAQPKKLPITAILAPEVIKGYIFVEANGPHFVDEAIAGTRHARTRTKGVVSIQAIERFIVTKPVIEELSVGNLVEVLDELFWLLRIDCDPHTYAGARDFFDCGDYCPGIAVRPLHFRDLHYLLWT